MRQALYRKYRPTTFEGVLGQDNIVSILKNQIIGNKISHAYVFSGTRGTGKTTCAKIFSKAVNCLNPKDGNPCNECENCRLISEESTMDVIEMDAASNRRIDDIRQLREKVIYPPSNLKYKVYIVDEAHMITNEGFNALLKIMEEPPSHLIFILATTEIEKIPDTILSRTQRFEFKKIDKENIEKQIKKILDKENVRIDQEGIEIISNIAQGAMRDALSVLDQVISVNKREIRVDEIYDLLGIFSYETKRLFSQAIFNRDLRTVLEIVNSEIEKGKDSHNFIKELISYFRDLLMTKLKISGDKDDMLKNISVERIVNSIDILLEYEEIMKKSDNSNLVFQIACIRLSDFMPRKDLEGKINSLEERVIMLEKSLNTEMKRSLNREEAVEQSPELIENLSYFEGSEKYVEAESEKAQNLEELREKEFEEAVNEVAFEDKKENDDSEKITDEKTENQGKEIDLAKDIKESLLNKYPHTNMIFNGLRETKVIKNKVIYSLDKSSFDLVLGMNFFIRQVENDFSAKLNKTVIIEFEEFKEMEDNEEVLKLEKKLEELRRIFPENKLKIEK
ncbi:MAG: DNA polymerase III subunit gamma/tau [Tissierellia bacterium]|nr:DNA polymerase III subunit gamma/tau [Tissierellia bacterium]